MTMHTDPSHAEVIGRDINRAVKPHISEDAMLDVCVALAGTLGCALKLVPHDLRMRLTMRLLTLLHQTAKESLS